MSVVFDKVTRNVCTILINRPTKRNALNLETIKNLRAALEKFERDDTLSVAILAGASGNFSSGYDLNEIINPETSMPQLEHTEQMLWPICTRLSEKKITIAAIEGHAAGFGYELALKCDFRVASRDSRMGFMNRRFGIPIMNGGTVILPAMIGKTRALDLISTGKAQLAPEALQYGAINYISDIGCALGRSLNLARCLAKFNQASLLHDLKSMASQNHDQTINLLKRERAKSIRYLQQSGPLHIASKFLSGELCRHGNFDLGNMLEPDPEMTL